MNKRIVYPDDNGGVVILMPILDCGLSMEEIIAKDVPSNKPYKIVDVSEIPTDQTFRNAWEFQE